MDLEPTNSPGKTRGMTHMKSQLLAKLRFVSQVMLFGQGEVHMFMCQIVEAFVDSTEAE